MGQYGYKLIMDAAIFWASRLEEGVDGQLHINDVVGPDEYHEHVNNNAFTNYMVRWNLQKAMEYYDLLKAEKPRLFRALDAKLELGKCFPRWVDGAARTLHDSSLSLSTHSVQASDLGQDELAYNLFRKAAMVDLGPYMGSSDAGIHAASFGGTWAKSAP